MAPMMFLMWQQEGFSQYFIRLFLFDALFLLYTSRSMGTIGKIEGFHNTGLVSSAEGGTMIQN